MKFLNVLAVVIPFEFFQVTAQTSDTLKQELKEVSIVGTRIEKNILQTGRTITVLTREDLKNNVYTSIAEIIGEQSGIYMVGSGQTPGSNQSIFMRGANSNQTAVYVDGVRIRDVSTVNSTADLSELPLQSVERIEIIRGAHSTAYGASAIGGVIQIFTNRKKAGGFHLESQLTSGTFGSGSLILNPAIQSSFHWRNGIGIFLNAELDSVRGIDATTDTVTNPLAFHHRDRDDWFKKMLNCGINYSTKSLDATLTYAALSMHTGIDKGAFTDDDNFMLDFKRQICSGKLEYKINKKTGLEFNSSYSSNTRTSIDDSSVTDYSGNYDHNYVHDRYSGQEANSEMLFRYRDENFQGILGTSGSFEKMNAANEFYSGAFAPVIYSSKTNLDTIKPEIKSWSGIYLQADMNGKLISPHLKNFNLLVGGRFADQLYISGKSSGSENILKLNSLEINPSVQLNANSLIYFSFTTGYQAPSLYQLFAPDFYYPFDLSQRTGLTRGNPQLKSETSSSLEFGLKQRIDKNGFIGISIFQSRTKNQIDYTYLWNPSVPIDSLGTDFMRDDYRGDRYLNIGTQTVYGIEVTLENQMTAQFKFQAQISLMNGYLDYSSSASIIQQSGGNRVQLFSNGTFLDGSSRYEGLTRRPNTASAQLIYNPSSRFHFAIKSTFISQRNDVYYDPGIRPFGALRSASVSDYTLLELNGRCTLNEHFSLALRAENLFNKKYSEIRGFNSRGRGLYIKLMYTL